MSSNNANDRKRKPTNIVPDTVPSNDGRNPKERKARKVSTNAASLMAEPPPLVIENAAAASAVSTANEDEESIQSTAAEHEESIENVGKMIQDLLHTDNAKVDAALDALLLDRSEDKKKNEIIVTAGGCLALVLLLKKCVNKAIDSIPACDQVTELNELAELTTLHKTLHIMIGLSFYHKESIVGITALGGVEAVVKVMKSFPKCQALQDHACGTLVNLAFCNIVLAKAIESGGIEVVLAAINNHLESAPVCENACRALANIVSGSKENTGRLITLGGGAAVDKVRTKWADNNDVQTHVRDSAECFAAEWKARCDEE
jgi:hypothetical protein